MGNQWPFVGRSRELDRINSLISSGVGVLVLGAAGVGKTALARCAEVAAARDGVPVGRVFGHAVSRGAPFEAFAGVLTMTATSLLGPVEVARHVAVALGASPRRRVLFVVDDAHLLDDRSAQVLLQLAAEGTAIVIATATTASAATAAEPMWGSALPPAIDRLWRDGLCERVELRGLTEAEVVEVIETVLDAPVEPAASRTFARRSEGNPLLLRELVTAALDEGTLTRRGTGWVMTGPPPISTGIRDLVKARLAGLPDGQRVALETIAAGEPLPVGVAAELVGEEVLDELDADRLITARTGLAGPEVSSAHPLHGEVLRADMPPLRMRRVRLALAGRLEAVDRPSAHDLVRAALWRLEGGQNDDPERLLTAARAARVLSLDTAELLARRAHEASGSLQATLLLAEILTHSGRSAEAATLTATLPPDSLSPADREALVYCAAMGEGLLTGNADAGADLVGGALAGGGTYVAGSAAAGAVHGGADGTGSSLAGGGADLGGAADAAQGGAGVVGTALVGGSADLGGTDGADTAAEPLGGVPDAGDLLRGLQAGVPAASDLLRGLYSSLLAFDARFVEAIEAGTRIVEDPLAQASARTFAAVGTVGAEYWLGHSRRAVAQADAIAPVADTVRDALPFGAAGIELLAVCALLDEGELDLAEDRARRMQRRAGQDRDVFSIPRAEYCVGRVELLRGRPGAALRSFRRCLVGLTPFDHTFVRHISSMVARAAAACGEPAIGHGALDECTDAPRMKTYEPEFELARAAVLAAELRIGEAVDSAAWAAGVAADRSQWNVAVFGYHDVARYGAARQILQPMREAAAHVDGTLAPLLLDHASALAARDGSALDDVARRFESRGLLAFAAEACAEAALAFTAAEYARQARASAVRSAQLWSRCEGVVSPWLVGAALPVLLTARERQVAGLAALGQSDAAIADRLRISVRTVQTHLAHVYSKLGITRRSEIGRHLEQ